MSHNTPGTVRWPHSQSFIEFCETNLPVHMVKNKKQIYGGLWILDLWLDFWMLKTLDASNLTVDWTRAYIFGTRWGNINFVWRERCAINEQLLSKNQAPRQMPQISQNKIRLKKKNKVSVDFRRHDVQQRVKKKHKKMSSLGSLCQRWTQCSTILRNSQLKLTILR